MSFQSFFFASAFLLPVLSYSQFNNKLNYGTIKDVEGNSYNTIKIGSQTWMAENLHTTKYSDGTAIPVVSDKTTWMANKLNFKKSPMVCLYYDDENYTTNGIGMLYNWYAINPLTNGNKNVCPTGWHVPTDSEWSTLINFLGGEAIAGGHLKSSEPGYWLEPNMNATDQSGFSALPGGLRDFNGSFEVIGLYGYWWSANEVNHIEAGYRYISYNYANIGKSSSHKASGFSVRCIKD